MNDIISTYNIHLRYTALQFTTKSKPITPPIWVPIKKIPSNVFLKLTMRIVKTTGYLTVNCLVTIHSRYRRSTDRQTIHYDNSRTFAMLLQLQRSAKNAHWFSDLQVLRATIIAETHTCCSEERNFDVASSDRSCKSISRYRNLLLPLTK